MMYLPTLPELFARPWGKTLDLEFRRMRTDSRSEEHTSELQSQSNLVCRLLLEKKKLRGFCAARYAHADLPAILPRLSEQPAVRAGPVKRRPLLRVLSSGRRHGYFGGPAWPTAI